MRNRPSPKICLCTLLAALMAAVCAVWVTPARAASATCSVSGAVTASSNPDALWVEVTLYDAAGTQVAQTQLLNGVYGFAGLPEGTYRLRFRDPEGCFRDQYYNGATTLAGATPITLDSAHPAATANATLVSWGRVEGWVLGANSGAAAGVPVRLLDAAGQVVASSVSDAWGQFTFGKLEFGTYYVSAEISPISLGAFYPSALSLADATPLTLVSEAPTARPTIAVMERSGMPLGATARPDGSQEQPARLISLPLTLSTDGTTLVSGEAWRNSARVFAHTEAGWRLQGVLSPAVTEQNTFGWHHDVDGDTIAIAEYSTFSEARHEPGKVWIYRCVGGVWALEKKLAPAGSAYRSFGSAVALSGDTLLVGAPEVKVDGAESAGVVYVYTRSGSAWTQRTRLTSNAISIDAHFGDAISMQGSNAAIAAPRMDWGGHNCGGEVFMFTGSGGDWRQRAALKTSDGLFVSNFGETVALDHDTVAVGCSSSPDTGAIYVFVSKGDDSWTQQARLTPADGTVGWEMGDPLALDGDTIIAPAATDMTPSSGYAAGIVYVFRRNGDTWHQEAELRAITDTADKWYIGQSVAIAGGDLLVGSPREPGSPRLRVYHPYVTSLGQALEVAASNGVLANDSSSAGQTMTASLAAGPEHGTLDLRDDGSFTYAPDQGWSGDDTFKYLAGDGTWTSDPTTVTVTTRDPNAPNVAAENAPRGWVNAPVTVILTASDDTRVREIDYRRRSVRRWSRYASPFTVSAQGTSSYRLRALDVFGNVSRTRTLTVKVDTKAPVPRIPHPVAATSGRTSFIQYRIADPRPGGPKANVEIRVLKGDREKADIVLPGRPVGKLLTCRYRCNLPRGRYTLLVTAVDVAGNAAKKPARSTLTVR